MPPPTLNFDIQFRILLWMHVPIMVGDGMQPRSCAIVQDPFLELEIPLLKLVRRLIKPMNFPLRSDYIEETHILLRLSLLIMLPDIELLNFQRCPIDVIDVYVLVLALQNRMLNFFFINHFESFLPPFQNFLQI